MKKGKRKTNPEDELWYSLSWIILAISAGIALYGLYVLNEASVIKHWIEGEGIVVSGRINSAWSVSDDEKGPGSDMYGYTPVVEYKYEVKGVEYTSDRMTMVERSYSSEDLAQKILQAHPVGQKVKLYHDPADPSASVLDRSLALPAFVPLLIGLAMFLPCLYRIVMHRLKYRRK